jgi:hypothetical protein
MKNYICLICYEPSEIWIDFLNKFKNYNIYIIIDNNNINFSEKYKHYEKINFIQIKYEDCNKYGFKNMTLSVDLKNNIKERICGWDKALYYFSKVNNNYDNIWFLEDDVFFYNETTLLNIDSKYMNSDLLTNNYQENLTGYKKFWHWDKIDIKILPPYYKCMACATRLSKLMISNISDYATKYNTLFFLEVLFPTICKSNKLIYDNPIEFKNIVYREEYNIEDINKFYLYHPVKDTEIHQLFRNKLL